MCDSNAYRERSMNKHTVKQNPVFMCRTGEDWTSLLALICPAGVRWHCTFWNWRPPTKSSGLWILKDQGWDLAWFSACSMECKKPCTLVLFRILLTRAEHGWTSPWQEPILVITVGFFMSDLTVCARYWALILLPVNQWLSCLIIMSLAKIKLKTQTYIYRSGLYKVTLSYYTSLKKCVSDEDGLFFWFFF